MDHILTFTPAQLQMAERLAGDLTLAPLAHQQRHTSDEILRDKLMAEVQRTAALHAKACDDTLCSRALIEAYWEQHVRALDAYAMAFGRRPERIAGVWM